MAKKKFTARYERDADGHWTAVVQFGPRTSAISDGPTLDRARQRIRQAVSLHLEIDENSFDLVDDVSLPAAARRALKRYERERAKLEAVSASAKVAIREAVQKLSGAGLSRREAGILLGLTGARVQQVLEGRR